MRLTAAILMAAGLDPEGCVLFRQSDVHEHTELCWLLGTQTVLTGIRPEVARTFVELQIDLRSVVTRGTLQSGIAYALGSSRFASRSRRGRALIPRGIFFLVRGP